MRKVQFGLAVESQQSPSLFTVLSYFVHLIDKFFFLDLCYLYMQ